MKSLVAALIIIVALLALVFWQRENSGRANLESANAALAATSNKLAEASMQVTHHEQLAAVARTGLDESARALAAMSNTVATLSIDLAKSRADTVTAQARVQDFQARVAAVEGESSGLTGKLENLLAQIRNLSVELEQTRSNVSLR